MRDWPSYIPPGAFGGASPLYDPYGEVGQLVDPATGWSIGELSLAGNASPFGYKVGENGTARPAFEFAQPPPYTVAAMMDAQQIAVEEENTEAELLAEMLLFMF